MRRYPAGATLLYDSDPAAEEQETRIKATGLLPRSWRGRAKEGRSRRSPAPAGQALKLLLVDNDDCFIQTLANYARQTGAEVVTYRAGFPESLIERSTPDLILISPGPGRPADFGVPELVEFAARAGFPVFGVCLGLQGMVEAFGGELGVLDYPMHGKPSMVRHSTRASSTGLPERIHGRPLPFAVRAPEKLPAGWKSRRRAKTASSWACGIASCRSRPSSSIRNPCCRWKVTADCI